jgi:Domain of unknown function (DUF6438)/Ankyrin repeats (3 copies)/Ankyrin repeat
MTWGADIRKLSISATALLALGTLSFTVGALSQPVQGSDQSNAMVITSRDEVSAHELGYHYDLRGATRSSAFPGAASAAVQLELVVAPDGHVVSVEPVGGERDWYDRAVSVAGSWQYRPFERDGRAVYAKFVQHAGIFDPEVRPETRVPFPTISNWNSLQITLSRNIPNYVLEVRGDGTVIYQGGADAAVGGRHEAQIPQEAVRELFEAFRAADYFSTLDEYQITAWHFGIYRTSIAFDGHRKSVLNHLGIGAGIPTSVAELENTIDRLTGSRKWTHLTAETIPSLVSEGYFTKAERDTSILATMILADASPQIVRELIALGAPLNSRQPYGDSRYGTPLSAAAGKGKVEIVEILLAAGAGRSDRTQLGMALFSAAEADSAELVKTFLGLGADPNYLSSSGDLFTPLMLAALDGSVDSVAALIAAGANVNAKDSEGTGVLSYAVMRADRQDLKPSMDYVGTVRLLLEAGADPNACDDNAGSTPLMESMHPSVTKLLIDHGADPNKSC